MGKNQDFCSPSKAPQTCNGTQGRQLLQGQVMLLSNRGKLDQRPPFLHSLAEQTSLPPLLQVHVCSELAETQIQLFLIPLAKIEISGIFLTVLMGTLQLGQGLSKESP